MSRVQALQNLPKSLQVAALSPEALAAYSLLLGAFGTDKEFNGHPDYLRGTVFSRTRWLGPRKVKAILKELKEAGLLEARVSRDGLGVVEEITLTLKAPTLPGETIKPRKPTAPSITFNEVTKRLENISADFLTKMAEAFPGVDLEHEIKKAEAWLLANPQRRYRDYRRFLHNWFRKAHEYAVRNGTPANGKVTPKTQRNLVVLKEWVEGGAR